MEWYEMLITALGVAVPVVIAILTERNSIKKLDNHLNFGDDQQSMANKLGVEGRSIASQLGVGDNDNSLTLQHAEMTRSIVGQTGVTDRVKSLTEQHEDIYTAISSQSDKLSDIVGILHDNQIRREIEDTSQISLANTMAAFQQAFVDAVNRSYALAAENQELKRQLSEYVQRYGELNETPNSDQSNGDDQESLEQ